MLTSVASGRFQTATDSSTDDASTTLIGTPADGRFAFPAAIMGEFAKAPEIEAIADALIHEHRLQFSHLLDANIRYLWKAKGGKSHGKDRLGACQKPSGLLSFFSGVDFVIWLALDNCKSSLLTNRQVEALVFHELLHTAATEDPDTGEIIFGIAPHDFEGFNEELRIYGPWSSDLERVTDIARQLELF